MRVADAASVTLAAIAREPFEVSTIPTYLPNLVWRVANVGRR